MPEAALLCSGPGPDTAASVPDAEGTRCCCSRSMQHQMLCINAGRFSALPVANSVRLGGQGFDHPVRNLHHILPPSLVPLQGDTHTGTGSRRGGSLRSFAGLLYGNPC
jgi:hypothetical protein